MYQNYFCVYGRWITNCYHFQVIFEVAFNSAKGGYVALDDISFSPVYCSNQTGTSSYCCLPSLFSLLALLLWTVCQYLQYLVVMCRCCLVNWPVPLDSSNAIHLTQKPVLNASSPKTWPQGSPGVVLDRTLYFASTQLLNKLRLADMSQKERGISPGVTVGGGKCPGLFIIADIGNVIFYATCPEVFVRAKMGALLSCLHSSGGYCLSQSGVLVRFLLGFHIRRSQLNPWDSGRGTWDQGLCHLWVQPLK